MTLIRCLQLDSFWAFYVVNQILYFLIGCQRAPLLNLFIVLQLDIYIFICFNLYRSNSAFNLTLFVCHIFYLILQFDMNGILIE